ncbi:MAG: ABC transporter ATP-binding protein, partial [Myxococcota bacterium]
MLRNFAVLGPFLRDHPFRLVLAAAALVASSCLELLPHLVVYLAATEILADDPEPIRLAWFAAAAFLGVVARFLLLGIGYILSHATAFSVLRQLRIAIIQKLSRVPLGFFQEHPSGDLKKTTIDDVASLEGVLAHYIPELASGVLVPLLGSVVLFISDWRMGLGALVMMPIAITVQAVSMRGFGEAVASWHAAEARANEGVLEFIRGIVVLKAFDRDASSLGQVRDGVYGIRDLAIAMTRRSMAGYAAFFTLLSGNLAVVLPVGLWLTLSEDISREQLVLFVALGSGLLVSLLKLMFLFGNAQQAIVALGRVRSLLEA